MPSLRRFRVNFDRPDGTYAPGDNVSGRVDLELGAPKKVRGLRVTVRGSAQTHWTRSRSERDQNGRSETHTDHYYGSEEYFNTTYNILQSPTGDSEVHLPVGHSVYPFSFQLPQNIPCSFEHHYGYIRYTVKAVIDRPWKFDHECKAAFTVVTPRDLNTRLPQREGITDDIDNNFSCFCCFHLGSMNATISFPSVGYVPGQTIDTKVSFENRSSKVDVTRVCVALGQSLTFRTSNPPDTMSSTTDVKKVAHSGPFAKKEYLELKLKVPPIPPSRLEYCGIIDLKYTLDVTIHVSGWHCSTQKRYPIEIGTIPLRPTPSAPTVFQVEPTPIPTAPFLEDDTEARSSRLAPLPIGFAIGNNPNIDWDMPPPSYEECMTRADSIKESDDSSHVIGAGQPFAPKYPVFNFSSTQMPRQ